MSQENGAPSFRVSRFLSGENAADGELDSATTTAQNTTTQNTTAQSTTPGQLVRRTVVRGGNDELRGEIESIRATLQKLVERGAVEHKVFDSLHNELKDYKNDFFYERLKPIVRPLLFLHDSVEQLDGEIEARATTDEALKKDLRENLKYLRTQMTEILAICEVTPIEETNGAFDAAIHKAVETISVAPDRDNTIQRVVRSGWYLNGTLLRPVEVVRGKA